MTRHRPLRPLWICRACAAPWPCGPARLELRAAYADGPVGLAIRLAAALYAATGDLLRLAPQPGPDPTELYVRFLAWTRRRPQR